MFFIIGDMQGGDKLCASAPVYSNTLKQMCRGCDVAGADAGNPYVVCQRIVSHHIKEMVAQKDLRVHVKRCHAFYGRMESLR